MNEPITVVVLGQGYVGLPLAMRAVEVAHRVVGFDIDHDLIDGLVAGSSHVEDITDDRLRHALTSGRYRPTAEPADLDDFDVAVITVPTPLSEGLPNLSHIEAAVATVAERLRPGSTVILESTTYPGTTDELVAQILEDGSGLRAGSDFHLGYSPERIDPGNPTWTFENTPKVVSGIDADSLRVIRAFYDTLVEETVPVRSTREAELTKLLENTFRHVNIALVNELAMFARDLNIDVWNAIDAAATKPFGFLPFRPGPGVGGHCLPVDPSYLSWRVRRSLGQTFRFVELANDVNEHMPDYVVRRLAAALNDRGLAVRGRRILVLGASYKRNTGDDRESPSVPVIEQLHRLGADLHVADPHVDPDRSHISVPVRWTELDTAEVEAADVILLLVDHDRFDLELLAGADALVFDTRNVLDGDGVETL